MEFLRVRPGAILSIARKAAACQSWTCRKAAGNFQPAGQITGGSTDSAAFTQGGFRAVGITGLHHKLEDYYHTRRDTYDNLNIEGLENCYRATVRLLEQIESGKLSA